MIEAFLGETAIEHCFVCACVFGFFLGMLLYSVLGLKVGIREIESL